MACKLFRIAVVGHGDLEFVDDLLNRWPPPSTTEAKRLQDESAIVPFGIDGSICYVSFSRWGHVRASTSLPNNFCRYQDGVLLIHDPKDPASATKLSELGQCMKNESTSDCFAWRLFAHGKHRGQVVDGVLIDLMQEICRKPVNLVQDEVINKGGWQIFARISCSSRTSSLPPCDGLAERHQSSRSNSLQVTEYRVDSSEMGQPLLNSSDHRESSSTCKCNV